jgi:hypothetical protein
VTIKRAHPYDEKQKHGFICSQRQGLDIFKTIPTDAPVIVAEAVWQYSYFVLGGEIRRSKHDSKPEPFVCFWVSSRAARS